MSNAKKIIEESKKNDHYPTPHNFTAALCANETFSGKIWEPCAGRGDMSKVLNVKNNVVSTTLEKGCFEYNYRSDLLPMFSDSREEQKGTVRGGIDFFKVEHDSFITKNEIKNIVTNPPFSISTEMLIKFLTIAKKNELNKVCILQNINFISSIKRYEGIYKDTPPSRIRVFSDRMAMVPYGAKPDGVSSKVNYAWFVWDFENYSKITVLNHLMLKDYSDTKGD